MSPDEINTQLNPFTHRDYDYWPPNWGGRFSGGRLYVIEQARGQCIGDILLEFFFARFMRSIYEPA